uniref:Rab11 family-interacting protein 2 n=1 Tax=Anolis carolinensis TaxID=28377 RepID=H9GGB5_ANOCA|nr:PREDICTED: rab11 family-interacting protein 2 [Anolis carolinensis]XP_008113018.1 PREDICTED: rab11 family-interacting protein 2 [Anolis carolinensis]XP_016850618.1 PREDICTED: rab11 family-interacting protein 2 [Anolis carolinensis]|eukprot:XP_003223542.1 PREDICTED: rab11 family-interacting protein 2 [Anolis carolinensis]
MLAEQTQKWFPTHVQVTVLQAKDLKPKGKSGTNDTYTIIQLGKEKYSTSVAEKTLNPVWKEEASFELPGLLMEGNSEKYILCLIVMHRSLVGLDKFLGQVAINLNEIFEDKLRRKTEWFHLESKQGKRTKDRGEIKVNIQFMRNNMTASMFDLSMKDKTKSPFAKLKDKMKGRKTEGAFLDTSSAIIPSTHMPESCTVTSLSEIQLKSKPKKPFLLGPQRLSSAHSMSDLTGPQVTSEKIKSGSIGNTYLFRRQLESFGSVDETGNLKSPHRRTLSADTSKVNQLDSTIDDSDSAFGAQNDPFTNVSAMLPQKFATLPRQKNPFEETPVSWDQNIGLFSKPVEIKKDIKREKKEKVSLFERVTGKKDSKRSDRLSNGGSDGSTDLKSPSALGENLQDSFDYDSSNPFMTTFKPISMLSSSSFNVKPASTENLRKSTEGNPFDATSGYRNLTYEEILQELVKHKEQLKKKDTHIRELEDYIDNLLVRVMEETPSILRVPYEPSRRAGKFAKS